MWWKMYLPPPPPPHPFATLIVTTGKCATNSAFSLTSCLMNETERQAFINCSKDEFSLSKSCLLCRTNEHLFYPQQLVTYVTLVLKKKYRIDNSAWAWPMYITHTRETRNPKPFKKRTVPCKKRNVPCKKRTEPYRASGVVAQFRVCNSEIEKLKWKILKSSPKPLGQFQAYLAY